ncbi:uncharacterized protein [Miscanthus floridulus]|uniref:uncharacterized protein n=1 Tax=Miscanthus floridulus TaxID=154761 RepID=UPI00345AD964
MVPTLATKPSAKQVWEAIRTMRIGDDRVRKSMAQSLREKYEQIAFRDGESVEDFTLRMSNLVQRSAILDDPEPEPKVVAKYLRVARPRYRQLVFSIETLLDINELTIEEVTGRLKAADDGHDTGGGSSSSTTCLNHMEEELVAWVVSRLQLSGEGGSGAGRPPPSKQPRGRGGGSSQGGGRGGGSKPPAGGDGKKKKIVGDECAYYGKTGHWARECRKKKHDEAAHAAQAVEEPKEGALLLGVTSLSLGENGGNGRTRWILDTGATNHMTGERSAFFDIDINVHGTIRFGDGSVVEIEGRGTILFSCKTGEHQRLADVYLIPKLTANIISLGQLDEDQYKVLIKDGIMRIWDQRRRLLAKVQRSVNRQYTLDLSICAPVCLAAHADDVA